MQDLLGLLVGVQQLVALSLQVIEHPPELAGVVPRRTGYVEGVPGFIEDHADPLSFVHACGSLSG